MSRKLGPCRTLILLLPFLMGMDLLHSRNRPVENGNTQMKAGKAEDALKEYDRAMTKLPNDPGVRFDRGSALFGLSRFEDAAQEFLRATEAKAPTLKASAFYNLGNSFFQSKKFGEAIEAYKHSLVLNPGDQRAKWNLELALKKKKDEDKKKEEEDKKNKNENKDKDKDKDKDKNKDKDKKDDKKKDDKKDQPKSDEQKKQDQQQNQQDQKNPQPKPEPPADQKEIEAILESLEQSPKALEQERARLRAVRRQPPAKDW